MSDAERIAEAIKGKPTLIRLIEEWFYTDLDIDFTLKKGEQKLECTFESDAYYLKGVRHGGTFRRFIVYVGSDELLKEVEHLCSTLYNKEELIDLVRELEESYDVECPS